MAKKKIKNTNYQKLAFKALANPDHDKLLFHHKMGEFEKSMNFT